MDFEMNMDPRALLSVTRRLAVEAGLDTGPLDGIVKVGGIEYLDGDGKGKRGVLPRANIYTWVLLFWGVGVE